MTTRRACAAVALATTLLLAGPGAPASATFHEMSIREVYPGSATEPKAEYVELQMWHSGQNFVGGHTLRTYSVSGTPAASTFQCKLDRKPFRPCHSPFTTKILSLGRHTFAVRARDDSGNLDPSPASYAFKVVAR